MPGHQDVWRTEPDGSVAADVCAFRLVVQVPEDARGSARFVVGPPPGQRGCANATMEPSCKR
jgi:hypothetical protein